MSVWKDFATKRFWVSVLIMLASLVAVNGVFALLMTTGLIDHHRMEVAACVIWAMGAFVGGRFASRGKSAPILSGVMVTVILYAIVWAIALFLGENGLAAGVWWKSGVCALAGAVAAGLFGPGKRKKRRKGRGKQTRRKVR